MSRPKNAVPQPRQHKGRAVLDVYENGIRRTRTLGAWSSSEAEDEYKRFLAEFATGTRDRSSGPDIIVNAVLAAFLKHAHGHYPAPTAPQLTRWTNTNSSRGWCEKPTGTRSREFDPFALKAGRRATIDRKWCRALVNRARRVFKWFAGLLAPIAWFAFTAPPRCC